MCDPLSGTTLVSVLIRKRLSAKNLEKTIHETELQSSETPYPGQVTTYGSAVKWLVVVLPEGRFGWPLRAAQPLVDEDSIRVFNKGVEQDVLQNIKG